ncbi:MAG: N-acetyl-gamma-glutamyl-phosphate reductase [Thermoflexales bacterium]|nr:N-acetyl-gamma-glutamyl-phosphate reductase [Thermoflexales bacterium]MCS7325435.1 N-acetyl-gamma-glutamyl-phosphate reductase [Thermoflexales bacterium]MCX7940110.1 N-acetyl-gamma-glutamyl-phosphate reductase [Thermoflexales bacterium]MDW8054048.1 N-acetyl-gamma-glutamyl-phosphate reductase [Anaerolineae bacterium]MDW8292617.1 N-acetyl-gamma-glutamyl-phosphate reductase [Anaerolineae bacterium]
MNDSVIHIGIFGATGYTGAELVRWLARHRRAHIVFAHSESNAGAKLSDVLPVPFDLPLVAADDAPLHKVDVVFSCLPHGASASMCQRALEAGARVIDLSADFRLRSTSAYAQWYAHEHPAPHLLAEAVYGLPERYRTRIRNARLVANPGCYPTSIVLGVLPLLEAEALAEPLVIADSKSGVSGAGRKPTLSTHFVEVNESLAPYNIGHVHRHVPEIEQELSAVCGSAVKVWFSPHLLPISRGMLSMIYVRLTPEASCDHWQQRYAQRYAEEPFVRVLPQGQISTIAHAAHTNYAVISVHHVADLPGCLQIVSCIDNLVKGASGQAIQNMNLMFGFDETEGLQ